MLSVALLATPAGRSWAGGRDGTARAVVAVLDRGVDLLHEDLVGK